MKREDLYLVSRFRVLRNAFICMTTPFERNSPYEEVWVQLPKLKLRCPLVKP